MKNFMQWLAELVGATTELPSEQIPFDGAPALPSVGPDDKPPTAKDRKKRWRVMTKQR